MAAQSAPGSQAIRGARPRTPTRRKALAYVQEFLGRLDVGDQPGLRSFIEDEVPAYLREEVFEALDRELANREQDEDSPDLRPKTEVYVSGVGGAGADRLGRWVAPAGLLVPWSIRGQLLGNVRASRKESLAMNEPRWKIERESAREILEGIAQRAPLCTPVPDLRRPAPGRERARRYGWFAWRLCGPALFAGYLFGSVGLVASGAVLLLIALCALMVVALEGIEELNSQQARFVNALLGGTVTVVTLTIAYAGLCLLPFALSLWTPFEWLATTAVHVLAFLSTATLCAITARGWSPEEWLPERLVRV